MSCCSSATSEALEFPALLSVVAGFAATDAGRRLVCSVSPHTDPDEIGLRRTRYAEVARELEGGGVLVPVLDQELLELRRRLETGGRRLGGAALQGLAAVIEAGEEVLERLGDREETPRLATEVESLRALEAGGASGDGSGESIGCAALAARLRRSLDRHGAVRDDASPRLRRLARESRSNLASVEAKVQAYVREHGHRLADHSTPMRGGRFSVLLPSGSRGRLSGLVRGRSASGRSFHFEPSEVVEGNDELERIAADKEVERARILAELVRQALDLAPAILARIDFLAAVDALQAVARFGAEVGAGLAGIAPPSPDGSAAALELRGARHPLLDPLLAEHRERTLGAAGNRGEVVPLDLALLADQRTLVLTGPNAGGKTVALKTVGLLCLMTQAGMPVPAASDSRFPIFDHLVAVVGDDQSVLDEQSTFSARLLRLQEVWRRAGPRTLVLLDEVGAGTNPEEGAALGIALLEGLVESASLGILTTHLTQLAAAALESRSAACAAMSFDPHGGLPTYRLVIGPPGGSRALALARRLGLPAAWLERAEHFLGSEHRQLRRVLERNERLRERLLEREAALARLTAETEAERGRFQIRQASLLAARKRLDQAVRREVDALRRGNRGRLDQALAELAAQPRPGKRAFARAAGDLHRELSREAAAARERAAAEAGSSGVSGGAVAPGERDSESAAVPERRRPLVIGAPVRHRSLGWVGKLQQLSGDRATVLVLGKRVQAARSALEAAPPVEQVASPRVRFQAFPAPAVEPELMLIGQKVDPALDSLDAYLDRALASGRERVRVIHGHGSGRLRRAVREHLRRHPAVAGFNPSPPSAGGDGSTEVVLR